MRIDQAILGLFQNKKIEKIYYKNYKIFDYDENKVNRPCYLEFPLNINKNDIIAQVFYKNGLINVGMINKLEFIYYEDFNARFEEYNAEEYVVDLLHFKKSKNTFEDYFLNDDKTIYFQLTYQRYYGYNVYIISLTQNIIIKNNRLTFQNINSKSINRYFKYIKFNNLLHLENPSAPVDLSNCFACPDLIQIEDFEKIGITKVSNLGGFCSGAKLLESGLNLFFQNLETSYVKSLNSAFRDCRKLTDTILLQNIHLANNCDSDALNFTFENCYNINLSSNQIRHFDFTKLTEIRSTFDECHFNENDNIIDFSNLDFSNVTTLRSFLKPYYKKNETQKYVDFSNTLFPDLSNLYFAFSGLGNQVNFLNVYFPKADFMYGTFAGTTPINFDLDTNIFNNPNITRINACFSGSDLTSFNMNTLFKKVIDLPLPWGSKHNVFESSKIDSLNFNNTIFEYSAVHTLIYTKDPNPREPQYLKDEYTVSEYADLQSLGLFTNAKINTVNMNNCTFKNPVITTTERIVDDPWEQYNDAPYPYFNYFDILFDHTYIDTLNMNNCIFGEHMIPSFWCYKIKNINLNNPQPYTSGQPLLCDRFEKTPYTKNLYRTKIIDMTQWIEHIFNDFSDYLNQWGLISLSLQDFQFQEDYIFGEVHVAEHTQQYKTTGLYNENLSKIDLSGSNISSLFLERLEGNADSGSSIYHEYIDKCHLNELILSNIQNNEFLKDEAGYLTTTAISKKINLSNNVFDYDDFEAFMHTNYKKDYTTDFDELNISNVILNNVPANLEIDWLAETMIDTNLELNIYDYYDRKIENLKILGCKTKNLNLNTILNGCLKNNINTLKELVIRNISKLESITLLPSNKMNFISSTSYYESRFCISYNDDLTSINFMDNDLFEVYDLAICNCPKISTPTIHNVFQHIKPVQNNNEIGLSLYGDTGLQGTCDLSKINNSNGLIITPLESLERTGNPYYYSIGYEMFGNCKNLTSINFNNLKLDTGENIFIGCSNLQTITNLKFNGQIPVNYMFSGCENLLSVPAIPGIPDYYGGMYDVFKGCSSLTQLDVSNFNTTNAKSLSNMFEGCSSLTQLDVSNFDASNVISFRYMFKGCNSLNNLKLFDFPTSLVETENKGYNYNNMFENCTSLTQLDLNDFYCYIKEVHYSTSYSSDETRYDGTSVYKMFYNCINLQTIYTNNYNFYLDITSYYPSEEDYWVFQEMFYNCNSLVGENGTSYADELDSGPHYAKNDGGIEDKGYFTYRASN